MGHVNQETLPALHMLQGIGFEQISEVDPFDGGPHIQCSTKDVSIIKQAQWLTLTNAAKPGGFEDEALVGIVRDNAFLGGISLFKTEKSEIVLPEKTKKTLALSAGEKIYFSPLKTGKKRGN